MNLLGEQLYLPNAKWAACNRAAWQVLSGDNEDMTGGSTWYLWIRRTFPPVVTSRPWEAQVGEWTFFNTLAAPKTWLPMVTPWE